MDRSEWEEMLASREQRKPKSQSYYELNLIDSVRYLAHVAMTPDGQIVQPDTMNQHNLSDLAQCQR